MKIAGVEIPDNLLNALRDRNLVVFAGTGTSRKRDGKVLTFDELAKRIAKDTGEKEDSKEPPDRLLGRLKKAGTDVHSLAADVLSEANLQPNELHKLLLRFYPDAQSVRIVTSNFDRLFEVAAEKLFKTDPPEVFRAPALPSGSKFKGIAHIHGSLVCPGEMVLTDQDFGRAYLTKGWASRFLVDLFQESTVLFVGHGHNEAIMQYLARALPVEDGGTRRFALTVEENWQKDWESLGIEALVCPGEGKESSPDYAKHDKFIERLSEMLSRSAIGWRSKVKQIAENAPPVVSGEREETITWGFLRDENVKFFTEAATDPEWMKWLEGGKYLDRENYLASLFDDRGGTLDSRSCHLPAWLADRFTISHADQLLALIARHGTRLHPDFWSQLCAKVASEGDNALDKKTLSRWIAVLCKAAPSDGQFAGVRLVEMGKRCHELGATIGLLQIFARLARGQLELQKRTTFGHGQDADMAPRAEFQCFGDGHELRKFYEECLKPRVDKLAESLLREVASVLEEQYRTLQSMDATGPEWDRASYRRSAIETHEQDEWQRNKVDYVLIDVARDCLESLAKRRSETAVLRWCNSFADSAPALLRRLAIHTIFSSESMTVDDKIQWLLEHIALDDIWSRHEIFQALKTAYPTASKKHRKNLIERIVALSKPRDGDSKQEERGARACFDMLHWLVEHDPDCALAQQASVNASKRHPKFVACEHPDLLAWSSFSGSKPESPWSVPELLAKPAVNWLPKLLKWRSDLMTMGARAVARSGLIDTVSDAATQDGDWGLDLAEALASQEQWQSDLWSGLIGAWSKVPADGDEANFGKTLDWLACADLQKEQQKPIARAIDNLMQGGGRPFPVALLPRLNKIAATLWSRLDREKSSDETVARLDEAINHPAVRISLFWMRSLSLWREHHKASPSQLGDEYRRALDGIVKDSSHLGRLGRSVLASQFGFLLAIDEVWTKKNLLPLFRVKNDDFQLAWDGFLVWGELNPAVIDLLSDAYLEAVREIEGKLSHRQNDFIGHYTWRLRHLDSEPATKWISEFFKYADLESKAAFTDCIGDHLRDMEEGIQREWWRRWLKRYWKNRTYGKLGELTDKEIVGMLAWLPDLPAVFPEAINLAIQMPPTSLPVRRGHVLSLVLRCCQSQVTSHPKEIAKLLIYLGKSNWLDHVRDEAQELMEQIIRAGLRQDLESELRELAASQGITLQS